MAFVTSSSSIAPAAEATNRANAHRPKKRVDRRRRRRRRRAGFHEKTRTYVRTYARTAYAVQEPQYTVASSRLVDYQGAMADCTEASELFATIAVRSN